ncbi:MAG: hypothetical protein ABSF29_16105 [Tepidisphaeraceae bacterium]
MAVFCVFGMISFLYGLVPQGMRGAAPNRVVGDLHGQQITASEMQEMRNEWQTLKELHFVDPNNPDTDKPFLTALLQGPADVINKQPDTFFLLVREAQEHGVIVNPDDVQSILTNNVAGIPAGSDSEGVAKSINDCLMVVGLLNSNLQLVKTNAPIRELWKARDAQMVALNLVEFSANHFLSKVSEPTEDDIKSLYDSFSDRVAMQQTFGSADDPMALGYKYANRVKVQFIGLKLSDLVNAAKASQSQQDWYVAAYSEFKNNRDQYDQQPVAAATKARALGPTTQPTAQHVDDLDADFALHVPMVLEHLYQQSALALRIKLLREISQQMNAGYSAWHDAQNAGATTQPGASQYTDISFIQNLGRQLEKESGITPVIGYSDQVKDARILLTAPGIGKSFSEAITGQPVPFAEYATMDPGSGGLSLWQPSDVFDDAAGNSFIFRISDFDASHTAPLAEVRDKVISDWKLTEAYKLALAAANNALADAQKRGFAAAAASAADNGGTSVITTDLFRPAQIVADPTKGYGIMPLRLRVESVVQLAVDSQKLLSSPPAPDGRPVDVAELWPDALVALVQLEQAMPMWDASAAGAADSLAYEQALHNERAQMINELCSYDSAAQRLNYKPVDAVKVPQ